MLSGIFSLYLHGSDQSPLDFIEIWADVSNLIGLGRNSHINLQIQWGLRVKDSARLRPLGSKEVNRFVICSKTHTRLIRDVVYTINLLSTSFACHSIRSTVLFTVCTLFIEVSVVHRFDRIFHQLNSAE